MIWKLNKTGILTIIKLGNNKGRKSLYQNVISINCQKKVTFLQFPGINVRLAEVSDPAGIKLLVCLHLAMGVTPGGQRS